MNVRVIKNSFTTTNSFQKNARKKVYNFSKKEKIIFIEIAVCSYTLTIYCSWPLHTSDEADINLELEEIGRQQCPPSDNEWMKAYINSKGNPHKKKELNWYSNQRIAYTYTLYVRCVSILMASSNFFYFQKYNGAVNITDDDLQRNFYFSPNEILSIEIIFKRNKLIRFFLYINILRSSSRCCVMKCLLCHNDDSTPVGKKELLPVGRSSSFTWSYIASTHTHTHITHRKRSYTIFAGCYIYIYI